MKWMLALAVTSLLTSTMAFADENCGDEGITCGQEERCCEHTIAMYSSDHAIAPSYIQGECRPKEQKCVDFSCGNRLCQANFFRTPSVCCVNTPEGAVSSYSCASNELSCPGNTEQLTIRPPSARASQRG